MSFNRGALVVAGAMLLVSLRSVVAEPIAKTDEVVLLLKELRPPDQLLKYKHTLAPPTEKAVMTPAGKEFEVKQAREAIDRAKAIVPVLRKAIKPGTSVFDYPGLLACSSISYDEHGREYECYLGVYLLSHERREPYDFRVVFDEKGVILEVKDVIHKQ